MGAGRTTKGLIGGIIAVVNERSSAGLNRRAYACSGGLRNQLVQARSDRGFQIVAERVDVGEFGEGPAAEAAQAVDAGDPIGLHRHLLHLGVLAAVALDLDHQVQVVGLALFVHAPVIHLKDEVGQIAMADAAHAVGHLKPSPWFFT